MRTNVFVPPSLKGAAISFRKESHSKPSNLHPQVACKVYVLSPKHSSKSIQFTVTLDPNLILSSVSFT